jgi:replicative DNA helicase Mcm
MELNLEEIEKSLISPFTERFGKFFDKNYKNELSELNNTNSKRYSITIDFEKLEKFDPILAEELLNSFDNVISAAEDAVRYKLDAEQIYKTKNLVKISNLPSNKKIPLKDVNSKYSGNLISTSGIIKKIGPATFNMTSAKWVCTTCGNVYKLPCSKFVCLKPKMCECHRKEFRLDEDKSEFSDYQEIQIQESNQPKRRQNLIEAHVYGEFVNKFGIGDKIYLVGVVKPLKLNKRLTKPIYEKYIEINNIEKIRKAS